MYRVLRWLFLGQKFDVLLLDLGRQSLQNPGVEKRLLWSHSLCRLPHKALVQEINELLILAIQYLRKILASRNLDFALRIGNDFGRKVIIEEVFSSSANLQNRINEMNLLF